MTDRTCEARRHGRGDSDCNGEPTFDVVYRTPDRTKVLTRTPTCFRHGLAEVDRAVAAGTIAQVEMEEHS